LDVSIDQKHRLLDAIRHVIEATDELRRAKEEYDRIFLVVEERFAEQNSLKVSPEPADGSFGPDPAVEKAADEDAIVLEKSADDRTLLFDRVAVQAHLVGIYPDCCPGRQIAQTLRIGVERIVSALKDLEAEQIVVDVGPDQWRYKKPGENP
jgi:hypothetical protein